MGSPSQLSRFGIFLATRTCAVVVACVGITLALGGCQGIANQNSIRWFKIVDHTQSTQCPVNNLDGRLFCHEQTAASMNGNILIRTIEYVAPIEDVGGELCHTPPCVIREGQVYFIVHDDRVPPLRIGDLIATHSSYDIDGFIVVRADDPNVARVYFNSNSKTQSEHGLISALQRQVSND